MRGRSITDSLLSRHKPYVNPLEYKAFALNMSNLDPFGPSYPVGGGYKARGRGDAGTSVFRRIDEAVRDVGSQLTGGRKCRSSSWSAICGYLGMLNMAVGALFLLWTFKVLGMTAKVTGACVGTFPIHTRPRYT